MTNKFMAISIHILVYLCCTGSDYVILEHLVICVGFYGNHDKNMGDIIRI